MGINFDFSPALSSFIGAIIGGVFTLVGAVLGCWLTGKQARDKQTEEDKKILKGLLQAIHDELESIFERYMETVGPEIEKLAEGKPFGFRYSIINDYFTVFNANASLIGHVPNKDLRKSIIHTYVLAKGMADTFQANNDTLSKLEYWVLLAAESKNPLHQQRADNYLKVLVDYAQKMKSGHGKLKESIEEVLARLERFELPAL